MIKTAVISSCGRFRYRLLRRWADGPVLLLVMFNPSTADHLIDDRTIAKAIGFAKAHDFGALEVVNLFAFRTKDPKQLRQAGYQVGPENDAHIRAAVLEASTVCLAWGALAADLARPAEVLQILRSLGVQPQCLRITSTGHPEHPLYLPAKLRLQPYSLQAITDAVQAAKDPARALAEAPS